VVAGYICPYGNCIWHFLNKRKSIKMTNNDSETFMTLGNSCWSQLFILSRLLYPVCMLTMFSWVNKVAVLVILQCGSLLLPELFYSWSEERNCLLKLFWCFSTTELIVLGGYNGGLLNTVEKYNIQTGDCMPLPFTVCLPTKSVPVVCT
jgi:hypothetical protein